MATQTSAIIQFFGNHPAHLTDNGSEYRFNASILYLKQYYEMYGNNPNVTWLPAEIVIHKTIEKVVFDLDPTTTIVGLAIFIWNEDYQYQLAKAIKDQYPDMLIVTGGPSVDVHRNNQYFIKHPYVDYAVYGDGEKAFQQIIDYVTGYIDNQSEFVNIAENTPNEENNLKLFKFERMTDDAFFEKSVYLEQKEYVDVLLNKFKETVGDNDNNVFVFHADYSRGCPYKCSFCDWNSGLHTKVKRFSRDWRAELDYFKKLDVVTQNIDANFGQWDEDLEILRYAVSLYEPGKKFRFIIENLTKLRKNNQIEILKIIAEVFKPVIVLSYQDLDTNVLNAIDRPSLTWDDQLEIIKIVRDIDPTLEFMPGLILGLPEQTFETVIESIRLLGSQGGIYINLFQNLLQYLPNSPMADPFYQRLHGSEFRKTFAFTTPRLLKSTDDLVIPKSTNFLSDLVAKRGNYFHHFMYSTTIYKTKKLSREDIVTILILSNIISTAHKKFNFNKSKNFEKVLFSSIPKAREYAKRVVENDEKLYQKYNCVFNFPIEVLDDVYKIHPNYIFRKNILNIQQDFGDKF